MSNTLSFCYRIIFELFQFDESRYFPENMFWWKKKICYVNASGQSSRAALLANARKVDVILAT